MDQVNIVSFGCGVQSTTLLGLIIAGELGRPDALVFADPGWESEATYNHLKYCQERASAAGLCIEVVRAGNIRQDIIGVLNSGKSSSRMQAPFYVKNGDGDKGMLWRKCTSYYKLDPLRRFSAKKARALLGPKRLPPNSVVQWIGISTDEAGRARYGKIGSDPLYLTRRYPLLERKMSRADCLTWLESHGWPEPPKSACVCCPYHKNGYWETLRAAGGQEWSDVVEFDSAIRKGMPGCRGEVFVHRQALPLPMAVDSRASVTDDGFRGECTGMCGN